MAKAQVVYNISIPIDIPETNKAQWTNVGVIVKTDSGKMFGKINFTPLPIGSWSGKFCLFPVTPGGAKGPGEYQEPLDQEPELG
jgi:hypothetical protein